MANRPKSPCNSAAKSGKVAVLMASREVFTRAYMQDSEEYIEMCNNYYMTIYMCMCVRVCVAAKLESNNPFVLTFLHPILLRRLYYRPWLAHGPSRQRQRLWPPCQVPIVNRSVAMSSRWTTHHRVEVLQKHHITVSSSFSSI